MILAYKIIFIITIIGSSLIALMVIFKKKKNKFDIVYGLMAVSFMLWAAGRYGLLTINDHNFALFWTRAVLYNGSILVHLLFLQTILIFLGLEGKRKIVLIFFYINSIFLLLVNNFDLLTGSNFFIKDVVPKQNFVFYEEAGILYSLHLINYIFIPFYSLIEILRALKKETGEKLQQIKYILFSSILGFLGGNSVVPLVYNIPIPPVFLFLIPFYLLTLAYAIGKYHLFDLKVIATELFVCAIWIILLIRLFISTTYPDIIINGVLFISMVIAGILLVRSILEEVRQREKLEKLSWEIKKAYEVEKNAYAELKKLDELKNQFTVATQHHLRTPLTSMRGYMDLIFSGNYGKIPKKLEEPLKKFDISTKRLIKIVNEFLDISQFQMGKKVVAVKRGIEIEPILQEAIEELKFEAETKGLYLKLEKPDRPLKVTADPEKLKVAVFNLVDNAIKYTKEGGVKITVNDGEKIHIAIKDTGIGIANVDNDEMFNKTFERGEEAKKVFTTGRGIGLYITSQIIKAHGGRIWAESEGLGKGATFNLELPVG